MKILDSEIQRFFNTKNWKIALRYHDQDVVDEIVIKESIPGFLYEINAVVNVYGYENHCIVLLNSAGKFWISPVNVRIASSRSLPVDISVLSC